MTACRPLFCASHARSTTMKTINSLQVRAAVLSHYHQVAKALGLNPTLMLRKVGLTPRMLSSST